MMSRTYHVSFYDFTEYASLITKSYAIHRKTETFNVYPSLSVFTIPSSIMSADGTVLDPVGWPAHNEIFVRAS